MKKTIKLSKRETEVAELLQQGLKNREIAVELQIDQKTVSTYIQRVRKKTGLDRDLNVYSIVCKYIEYKEELALENMDVNL